MIAVVAVAVRVAAGVWWKAWETPGAGEFGTIAANLLAGDGYTRGAFSYLSPSAARTPAYPLLLAGLMKLLGLPWAWMAALLLNAAAAAALAVLATRTALRINAAKTDVNDEHSRVAPQRGYLIGYALALWPTQIAAATYCQPGVLAATALVAMLALPRTDWLWSAVAAFLEPVLLPAVISAGIITRRRDPARLALIVAALLAVFVPWTLRNTISVGVFAPTTTTLWADAWAGNHEDATGSVGGNVGGNLADRADRPTRFDTLPPAKRAALTGKPEGQRTQLLRRWTLEWIAANPADYARLTAVRLAKTLWLDWDDARARHPAVLVTRTAWLGLVIAAIVIACQRRVDVWPMLAVMGGAVLIPMLTLAQMREVLVWEPVGLITCAVALAGAKR
ncbi:MAG: hypothetical protein AAF743_02555 [Planctomycetota bacterium]